MRAVSGFMCLRSDRNVGSRERSLFFLLNTLNTVNTANTPPLLLFPHPKITVSSVIRRCVSYSNVSY